MVGTIYIAKFLYPEYLPELHPEEVFKTWLEKYQQLHYIKGACLSGAVLGCFKNIIFKIMSGRCENLYIDRAFLY